MPATILHADLDAFYASVEQLFDPALRGKPVAVGGGVVLAASYEAKAFGVRGGMPGRRARELCPGLIFVGGHFKDYQRLGDAAIAVLGDFTPLVERISIDEAFADVAGTEHLFGPPADVARAIRRRVRAEIGLPISIGVARTKHLAKIASQVAKPDGLCVVDPARRAGFPARPAGRADVGRRARDPGAAGGSGHRHHRPARGAFPARAAAPAGAGARARSSRRWPGTAIRARSARTAGRIPPARNRRWAAGRPTESVFRPTLRHLADRVAARLRAKERPGRTVTVRVRFADLRSVTRAITLPAPVSATGILAEIAEDLVRGVLLDHPRERTISLLAIAVSNLEENGLLQLDLPLGLSRREPAAGQREGRGALPCRPRHGRDPRAFRAGGGGLRLGAARPAALGAGCLPRAGGEGALARRGEVDLALAALQRPALRDVEARARAAPRSLAAL